MNLSYRAWFLAACVLVATDELDARTRWTDANGDGLSDVENIREAIDDLMAHGVLFDDTDSQGHIPIRRSDGRYHMACVDLVLVAYRRAGYDLVRALEGGALIRKPVEGDLPSSQHGGSGRQITQLIRYMKSSPAFTFHEAWGESPLDHPWHPRVPLMVGDILFLHYIDSADRHSGIVTAVDPRTGVPTRVAQISSYNRNGGLDEVGLEELFNLECRRVSGYARPTSWDAPR